MTYKTYKKTCPGEDATFLILVVWILDTSTHHLFEGLFYALKKVILANISFLFKRH